MGTIQNLRNRFAWGRRFWDWIRNLHEFGEFLAWFYWLWPYFLGAGAIVSAAVAFAVGWFVARWFVVVTIGAITFVFIMAKRAAKHRPISAKEAVAAIEQQGDKGFLDYLVGGLKATKALAGLYPQMTEATNRMTKRVEYHTSRITKEQRKPSPDFEKMQRVASEAAQDIDYYADQMQRYLDDYQAVSRAVADNSLPWIQRATVSGNEAQGQLLILRNTVLQLRTVTIGNQTSLQSYSQSLEGLMQISQDLNKAGRKLRPILAGIMKESGSVSEFCGKFVNIIDEKLAQLHSP